MQEINPSIMQAKYDDHLRIISDIFDYASEFLSTNLGEDYKMPIPVGQIAKNCGLSVFENALRDLDSMERDSYGGFAKFAESSLRRKHCDSNSEEIVGTINVEHTLSTYEKRFYIAHELARCILTDKNEVYPIKLLPIARGEFSLCESTSEFLANTLAYGILMPYEQVMQAKAEYEDKNSYNPLIYGDWIDYLQHLAQIPKQYVILGYEEIRKSHSIKN